VDLPAGIAVAPSAPEAASDEGYEDYEWEDDMADENVLDGEEVQQPPPGRPRQYNCKARPPLQTVLDDDYVAKLKFNIPSFEGRYNLDA
jgi:hypothetical protein